MSKRFLSAVLALALCTGLSACSENPNDINANSVSETTAIYESTKEIVIPDETVTPDEYDFRRNDHRGRNTDRYGRIYGG